MNKLLCCAALISIAATIPSGQILAAPPQPIHAAGEEASSVRVNEFLRQGLQSATPEGPAVTVQLAPSEQQRQRIERAQAINRNLQNQFALVMADAFTPTWYSENTNAWTLRYPHADASAVATWKSASSWLAIDAPPTGYGDGNTLVYQENFITTDASESFAVAPDRTEQAASAAELARLGRKFSKRDAQWLTLGIFALVPGDAKSANQVVQLSVSREGAINGSYVDLFAADATPVRGGLDKQSQRVAWTIGDNKSVVFETALSNLTDLSGPLLVRYGAKQTQNWHLVRVNTSSK